MSDIRGSSKVRPSVRSDFVACLILILDTRLGHSCPAHFFFFLNTKSIWSNTGLFSIPKKSLASREQVLCALSASIRAYPLTGITPKFTSKP